MSRTVGHRIALVHVLALFALAVSYPLLDMLGRSPEFFVAQRLEGRDLWAFVALVSVGVPLVLVLLAWVAGRLGGRTASWTVGTLRALLAAAVVLQAIRHFPAPGWVLALGAAAAGLAVEVGCRRSSSVRLFVALLVPAFALAPLLFVFSSPSSRLLRPVESVFFGDATPAANVPVVLVVFDQLPLVSLMDAGGAPDPGRGSGEVICRGRRTRRAGAGERRQKHHGHQAPERPAIGRGKRHG